MSAMPLDPEVAALLVVQQFLQERGMEEGVAWGPIDLLTLLRFLDLLPTQFNGWKQPMSLIDASYFTRFFFFALRRQLSKRRSDRRE